MDLSLALPLENSSWRVSIMSTFFSVFLVLSDGQLITRIVSNYWRWLILIFFCFCACSQMETLCSCSWFFLLLKTSPILQLFFPPYISVFFLPPSFPFSSLPLFPLTSHSVDYQKLWGVDLLVTASLKMNKRKTFTTLYSHVTQCYPDHSKESAVTSWRVKRCDLHRLGWVPYHVCVLPSKWVS